MVDELKHAVHANVKAAHACTRKRPQNCSRSSQGLQHYGLQFRWRRNSRKLNKEKSMAMPSRNRSTATVPASYVRMWRSRGCDAVWLHPFEYIFCVNVAEFKFQSAFEWLAITVIDRNKMFILMSIDYSWCKFAKFLKWPLCELVIMLFSVSVSIRHSVNHAGGRHGNQRWWNWT